MLHARHVQALDNTSHNDGLERPDKSWCAQHLRQKNYKLFWTLKSVDDRQLIKRLEQSGWSPILSTQEHGCMKNYSSDKNECARHDWTRMPGICLVIGRSIDMFRIWKVGNYFVAICPTNFELINDYRMISLRWRKRYYMTSLVWVVPVWVCVLIITLAPHTQTSTVLSTSEFKSQQERKSW